MQYSEYSMKRKNALVNDIKKDNSPIVEFCIYKDFPLSGFLYSILVWIIALLMVRSIYWLQGEQNPFSIRNEFILCAAIGIIVYLPSYFSALIMNRLQKPILRFNSDGFYYTPQIWSRSKLYRWKDIATIEMGRNGEDELLIKLYLSNGKCVSINETIIPIDHKELLRIFDYCLQNISMKYPM